MEALSWWHTAKDSLQRFVLPHRCLLCGGEGADSMDLCRDCAAELPRNQRCCARCALPLAEPAALCGQCQRQPPPWDAAWVPFRYAWPLDRLETRFKFGADLAAGRVLSMLWLREMPWAARPDLIVPVPLHPHRLRVRGHNQALELARPLARAMDVPLQVAWLSRERGTAAQTELGAVARRRNVRRAFAAKTSAAWPGHVVLLDDVMTTGATLGECSRVLRQAGVERIDVWALARAPITHR
ncbi:ComF family protein [Dyella jiangningensis]|uniref:Amidophosphoribosyltransferase n=1 Tax=Dyella jiangningensis TaxID=1379159 RepID=A0A328P7D6_9GAMM|nr:ComF family protein [Dyella jiangningensis]RAO76495.1 amidophosphoribosyltransferase [Dyella jiangningensis]